MDRHYVMICGPGADGQRGKLSLFGVLGTSDGTAAASVPAPCRHAIIQLRGLTSFGNRQPSKVCRPLMLRRPPQKPRGEVISKGGKGKGRKGAPVCV